MIDNEISSLAILDPPPTEGYSKSREIGVNTLQTTSLPDIDRDPSLDDRVFWKDGEYFFAAISLGFICEGHTLICPHRSLVRRSRACSMYDAVDGPRLVGKLVNAVDTVIKKLLQQYGNSYVVFEHGNIRSSNAPATCGTAYPHLHIVPSSEGLVTQAEQSYGTGAGRELRHYRDMMHFYNSPRGAGQYLLVSDKYLNDNNRDKSTLAIWSGLEFPIPSQALRHALQDNYNMPIDDWQDNIRKDEAISQAKKMLKVCQK